MVARPLCRSAQVEMEVALAVRQSKDPNTLVELICEFQDAAEHNEFGTAATIIRSMLMNEPRVRLALHDKVGLTVLDSIIQMHYRLRQMDDAALVRHYMAPVDNTEVRAWGVTTEELAERRPESVAMRKFDAESQLMAQTILQPGCFFYTVDRFRPGQRKGERLHLCFWGGLRWLMLGPIWKLDALQRENLLKSADGLSEELLNRLERTQRELEEARTRPTTKTVTVPREEEQLNTQERGIVADAGPVNQQVWDVLVEAGLIRSADFASAMEAQSQGDERPLSRIMVEQGTVSPRTILAALRMQAQMDAADITDLGYEDAEEEFEQKLETVQEGRQRLQTRTQILLREQSAERERIDSGGELSPEERARMTADVEAKFTQRLEGIKEENARLASESEDLRNQLALAQNLLEQERNRASTPAVSSGEDVEAKLQKLLQQMLKGEGAEAGENVQKMLGQVIEAERARLEAENQAKQQKNLSLLQRKVQRLAAQLEESEQAAADHRRRLELLQAHGGGNVVGNVYEAGLKEDDPDRERKLSLLKDIFKQNKDMRDHLAKKGRKLAKRPKEEKPEPAVSDLPVAVGVAEEVTTDTRESLETAAVAGGATADTAAQLAPAVESGTASAVAEAPVEEAEAEEEMSFGSNPDDMPWQPGMSFSSEPDLDDEDDGSVPKLTNFKQFEPPPLER
jgi:plasmid stability protein